VANIIGIDIGSCFVKLAEIEAKPRFRLINTVLFPAPKDIKSLRDEISKHLSLKKPGASIVGISLPNSAVSVISLLLPRMNKGDLVQAAITEARRRIIPLSNPNHIFEYSITALTTVAGIPKTEVLVIRTEKDYIRNLLNLLREAGVTPSFIAPGCCSVPNIIPKDLLSKGEDALFVDIGAASLSMHICKEGRLAVTRGITYGINDIIRDLSQQLNLSREKIEDVVREYGVPRASLDIKDKVAAAEEVMRQKYAAENSSAQGPGVNLLELRILWQTHIDRIVNELRRSFIYYKEQSGGRKIEYIYFLGGGSQIKNLVDTLSSSIGGRCGIIPPPFEGVSGEPIFANALSLALSIASSEYKPKLINFLPPELKKEKTAGLRRFGLFAASVCLIAVFAIASLNMFINNRLLAVSFKETEFELNRLEKSADKLKMLERQESGVKDLSSKIETLLKQKQDFALILEELNRLTPESILFARVSISKSGKDGGSVSETKMMPGYGQGFLGQRKISPPAGGYTAEIKAQLSADYENAVKIIGEFKKNLASSRYFSGIESVPLELERISSGEDNPGRESRLTPEKNRDFTLTFEISAK
jgi:Tfp pilus assembly PilM family ATPase